MRYRRIVAAVLAAEADSLNESAEGLLRRSRALRFRLAESELGEHGLIEAFTLMREACRRTIGLHAYDVQLLAAAALCEQTIAEMQTGEGKSLTAAFPLYYQGLFGRGSYLATGNDYLARRDAEKLRPAFALLGQTVGVVTGDDAPHSRRQAYRCDVTFGTGKEFGFDFLRDEIAGPDASPDSTLQRPPFAVLVDEADQVLIDDASTPLIISAPARSLEASFAARFRWAHGQVGALEANRDFVIHDASRRVELTAVGRKQVRELPQSRELQSVAWSYVYEDIERAVAARMFYRPDVDYVVRGDKVLIIDEFSGRIAEGRQWSRGLHQAIEAQEALPIAAEDSQAAQVAVQEFFGRFPKLSGMTGTVGAAKSEFRKLYDLRSFVVPKHRVSQRRRLPTRIFPTIQAKNAAISKEVANLQKSGRAILIGTRTIESSEQLSQALRQAGIKHVVLTAREIGREAAIVAEAGQAGRVTVATNMAGRGTDIKLGPGVAESGGLHVLLTEMHDASRIDRQLIGRGARQGDPGSCQAFLSLEDDLLKTALGPERSRSLSSSKKVNDSELPIRYERLFRRAQALVERRESRLRLRSVYWERRRIQSVRQMGLNPYLHHLLT